MKLADFLDSLPPAERERTLGRLEGMEMAMRIARNRAEDVRQPAAPDIKGGERNQVGRIRENEAQTIAATIRIVQVNIGNGTQPFGDLAPDEMDEVLRIY